METDTMAVFSLSIHADYRCRHSGVCCSSDWDVPVELAIYRGLAEVLRSGALQVAAPDGLPAVLADPVQVQQVVLNLVSNACRAGKDGETPSVKVRIGPGAGGRAVIEVVDDGVGMTPDVRSRIFEPFFTTKPPGQGTGLGLSTVYGIVRRVGGHVWLYSEVGWGATFKIYFPRVGQTVEPRTVETPRIILPADTGATILLVEDEPVILNVTAAILKKLGYRVLTANSPNEAVCG